MPASADIASPARKVRTREPGANARLIASVRRLPPRELFPAFPGTKDIRQHPVFQGSLSRWAWRLYTHRLTQAGRWFLGLTFLMGMSLAPGLDVQLYVPFVYICAVWLIALAAVLMNRPRMRVHARHAVRIRAGETLTVEADVAHAGRFWPGMDLNLLPTRLPISVDAVPPEGIAIGTLLPGESKRVRLGLKCPKRGVYKLWGFRIETDYPFGLLNAYGFFPQESELLVYPAFTPLDRMALPAGRRYQPGGVLLASQLGDSFEYLGNREYREGDNIRDIDWRATARHGGQPIALREWREEYFLRVGVVLDTYMPTDRRKRANAAVARDVAFERAVGITAAVADYMARQEYIVDLFAAGPDLYHLTAGRSLAYLDQILDILACVEGTPDEPLAIVAPQLDSYIARLTTVVCVFLDWNETRRIFVENLRASGAGVKVVLVRSAGEGKNDELATLPPDATVIEPDQALDEGLHL